MNKEKISDNNKLIRSNNKLLNEIHKNINSHPLIGLFEGRKSISFWTKLLLFLSIIALLCLFMYCLEYNVYSNDVTFKIILKRVVNILGHGFYIFNCGFIYFWLFKKSREGDSNGKRKIKKRKRT